MKKLIFISLISLLSVAAIQAQVAIGGSIGISSKGGTNEVNGDKSDKDKETSITFAPLGGFFISDKFLIGAQLSLSSSRINHHGDPEVIEKSNYFGITPFARYYALQFNKFSVFGQAQLGVGFGTDKTKSGSNTTTTLKSSYVGFSVIPGLAYDISEHIQLQANLNFLGFSSSVYREKDVNDDVEVTTSTGLNINMNNVLNTGNFQIGAIIKL